MSCPDCFTGSGHDGKPRGSIIKLHGLDTYVSEPVDGRQPRAIIIIIPDAFGWQFVNNRLLADNYAAKGDYTVYLPDFMEGKAAPLYVMKSMRALLQGNLFAKPYHLLWTVVGIAPFILINRIGKSWPRVLAFFQALRQDRGPDALIGSAGFCWGGKHTLLLAHGKTLEKGAATAPTPTLINAGFVGHPSFFDFATDIADPLTVPVSLALGDHDPNLSVEMAEKVRATVEALPPTARGEVQIYTGCGHGFCIRADSIDNKDVAAQASKAEDQCIAWFNKHFQL